MVRDLGLVMVHIGSIGEEYETELQEVHGVEEASRAMRAVRAIVADLDEIKRIHDAEIQALDEWAQLQAKPLEERRKHLERLLTHFHENVIAKNPKKLSMKFPTGKLVSRMPGTGKVEIVDEDAFLKAALPGMTKETLKEVPVKDAIKAHIEETGEQFPGVEYTAPERKFTVEITGA